MNELKKELSACPFCESEFVESEVVGRGHYATMCMCGARTADCDYMHEAEEIWNTRPIEDKLRAEIEGLKECIKKNVCGVCEIKEVALACEDCKIWDYLK